MARKKRIVLRIAGWILAGFISLILLVTLVFYLGRGWILHRVVDYVNKNQPGEIQVGRINLIPFMGFPDAVLQLRNISYFERKEHPDSLYQEPILSLDEIYISLDVVRLVRGEYAISRTKLEDGFVRMVIYEDSISNIERALGIRFDDESETDSVTAMPDIRLDMEKLRVENVLLVYRDRTGDDRLDLQVNRLESKFSYLPERIDADIELEVDVKSFKYLDIKLDKERKIEFSSRAKYMIEPGILEVASSWLRFAGLELDAWGTYSPSGMDLAFRARNSGMELLNFLFSGVLDLDEIEQIGNGYIALSGTLNGKPGGDLPVIRLNGQANRLGFRIKSIQRDVTGISFNFYATNGRKTDLSEAMIHMEGFSATFPEGIINADITASNVLVPEVKIKIDGALELEGLENMIESDQISSLKGRVALHGNLNAVIDRENSSDFLKDAGEFSANLKQVAFVMKRDTVLLEDGSIVQVSDTIRDLTGEIYLNENRIGTGPMSMDLNGSRIEIEAWLDNLILYLLGYETELHSEIILASDILYPGKILQDTAIDEMIGTPLQDLRLHAGITIQGGELNRFMENDSIPAVFLEIMNMEAKTPVYSDLHGIEGSLRLEPRFLELIDFTGVVGDSRFRIGGRIDNYMPLMEGDSASWAAMKFDLSSDLLKAEDFFTYRDSFLLPPEYRNEYLENFRLTGSLDVPGSALKEDPASVDFRLDIENMGLDIHFYPLPLRHFQLRVIREGNRLVIDTLRFNLGENSLMLSADLLNFTDTIIENWQGSLNIGSGLLDLDNLLDFQLPGVEPAEVEPEEVTEDVAEPFRLNRIGYPGMSFRIDIRELVYQDFKLFGLNGDLRTTRDKVIFLEGLTGSTESGGKIILSGQFNVSDPDQYTFSTEFDIVNLNIRDLPEMESGDTVFRLDRNFRGLVSMDGLAEVYISPDFSFDLDNTTAVFNVKIADGAMIDFSPLQVVSKVLDNRDLNNVRFATLQNSFPMTLSEGTINVPLTVIESTLGQMLIEGEQNLDNTFLYLLRLPRWLVWDAVKGRLTPWEGEDVNEEIYEYESGKFLVLTVPSDGRVRLGDKRDKIRDQE
jgi:hypothetical protein